MRLRTIVLCSAASAYLLGGSLAAIGLHVAIPAANWRGCAYIAATWPAWIKGSPLHLPIPAWAFSFEPEQGER